MGTLAAGTIFLGRPRGGGGEGVAEGAAGGGVCAERGGELGVGGGFVDEVEPFAVLPLLAPFGQGEPRRSGGKTETGLQAGPGVLRGVGNDVGADGVALDVGEGAPSVGGIHGNRIKTGLPEVSAGFAMDVDEAGVVSVERAEGEGSGLGRAGNRDQVVVVRHEAVAPDFERELLGVFGEKAEELTALVIGIEDAKTVVTALCEVVGNTGDDDAGSARHTPN